MALTLCGFAGSNYHNKVKLQLLEKGVAFEEELVWTGLKDNPALSTRSPLGKVPFLQTEQGVILESSVCCEYVEATYPDHPLIPKDPFAAAKVRELIVYLDWHMEMVARELYGPAFFGAPPAPARKSRASSQVAQKRHCRLCRIGKIQPLCGWRYLHFGRLRRHCASARYRQLGQIGPARRRVRRLAHPRLPQSHERTPSRG